MDKEFKELYIKPRLNKIGTVAALTAALGSGSQADQSEWPQMFPPNGGSFDVCINDDPDEVC